MLYALYNNVIRKLVESLFFLNVYSDYLVTIQHFVVTAYLKRGEMLLDKITNLKYDKLFFDTRMIKMYVDIIKNNNKMIKILKIIAANTVYDDNPGKLGTTKEMIMEHGFSKFHTDNVVSFLLGATLIYYDALYDAKGKYYSLTQRGSQIFMALEEGGFINDQH